MSLHSRRFETLDAMRGFAAIMVISRHTELFGTAGAESHSYLAVDLFFMLSGFVIAHAYERHLQSGVLSPMKFIAIRLVRLYPMFLLAVCLATVAALTRPEFEPNVLSKWTPADSSVLDILTSMALTIFFLPSRLGDSLLLFPLNTAFWSLMFELVVNILYVCVYKKLSQKVLWGVVIGSGVCLGALALRRNGLEMGWSWGASSIVFGLLRSTFGFATGVLLLRLFSIRPSVKTNFGAVLVIGMAIVPLAIPDSARNNGLIDDIAVLAVFPLAILLGAHTRVEGWLMRCFMWLGAASYPVYVLHIPSLVLFERYATQWGFVAQGNLSLVLPTVFLLIIFVTAVLLDHYYDQPVRRWLVERLKLRFGKSAAISLLPGETQSQVKFAEINRLIIDPVIPSTPPLSDLNPKSAPDKTLL